MHLLSSAFLIWPTDRQSANPHFGESWSSLWKKGRHFQEDRITFQVHFLGSSDRNPTLRESLLFGSLPVSSHPTNPAERRSLHLRTSPFKPSRRGYASLDQQLIWIKTYLWLHLNPLSRKINLEICIWFECFYESDDKGELPLMQVAAQLHKARVNNIISGTALVFIFKWPLLAKSKSF